MFKFVKKRDLMTFHSTRPTIQKSLSPWEIERVVSYVPQLKNPCVDEWTVSLLPDELAWLLAPAVKRMELTGEGYFIFWEDGFSRRLSGDETGLVRDYLKNKTTFRRRTVDYKDLPRLFQELWDKR